MPEINAKGDSLLEVQPLKLSFTFGLFALEPSNPKFLWFGISLANLDPDSFKTLVMHCFYIHQKLCLAGSLTMDQILAIFVP